MNANIKTRDFFIALGLAIFFLVPYEWYFKNVEHWPACHDLENYDLWADWRSTVDQLDSDDIIIMGSSRGHFDLNIHLWGSITGKRPLQLAYPGTSPLHPIEDLVNNTDFNGLLVISVAPGLFYCLKGSWPANQGKKFVDHYYKRTYAQRFSNEVYKNIDPLFSYTGTDLSLKSLIERIPWANRDSVDAPTLWPPMVAVDAYRNIRMIPEMETDTALQRQQTNIWFNPNPKNRFVDSIDVVIGQYVNWVKQLKARGGKVAFIRPPVTGYYLKNEPALWPREKYWDRMLQDAEVKGYHFQDYEVTNNMIPPEWSHLNRKDSDTYTKLVIELLKQDKLL